jgi:hypothetical protein
VLTTIQIVACVLLVSGAQRADARNADPPGAAIAAGVSGCPKGTEGPAPGRIFRVRNMSCKEALRVWVRWRGWMHVSLSHGGRFDVGPFRCLTYLDLTPPGPSDSDIHARCIFGRKEFRLIYAV